MSLVRSALELRMVLHADEEPVAGELCSFHELPIRGETTEHKSALFQRLTVRIVELVAVSVPLLDRVGFIRFVQECVR